MATRSTVTGVTAVTTNRLIPLPGCAKNIRGRRHHFCAIRSGGIAKTGYSGDRGYARQTLKQRSEGGA